MQEANSFSIKCKQCGKFFEAKGANAAYCPECRVERKKKLDHQAWLRRKYKNGMYTDCERRKMLMRRLEKTHAKELGIDEMYYYIWKDCNPFFYKQWMYSHLPPELVPSSFANTVAQNTAATTRPAIMS